MTVVSTPEREAAATLSCEIASLASTAAAKLNLSTVSIMEVCGTHTVAIFRHGVRDLLPPEIRLISGPGCPVCVTAVEDIDRAIVTAAMPDTVLTTFGDMMHVPGSNGSLDQRRAAGADIRVIYSPLDSLAMARQEPEKLHVLFSAGFETTAPTVAAAIIQAEAEGIDNLFVHSVHKTVPLAMKALLDSPKLKLNGFLCPGHVSAVIGSKAYEFIAEEYQLPAVVAGFEPLDILLSIKMILSQIIDDNPKATIQYDRVVTRDGNPKAQAIMSEVFEPSDSNWRGIGMIPGTGLRLNGRYWHRDAVRTLDIHVEPVEDDPACACGEILTGIMTPPECPLFAEVCSPENPVGACMVSQEGSCAAYYRFART